MVLVVELLGPVLAARVGEALHAELDELVHVVPQVTSAFVCLLGRNNTNYAEETTSNVHEIIATSWMKLI